VAATNKTYKEELDALQKHL